MGSLRRGLRAELAAILDVDLFTLDDTASESTPPLEATSTLLSRLILRSTSHPEEARVIYEFLPVIMLRIFGYAPGHGWLETASDLPGRDREALVRLILPEGPIHAFCKTHSPQRDDKLDVANDLRFEFLRTNLPDPTDRALEQPASIALQRSIKGGQSFLAQFLESSLHDKKDDFIYLSPLDYFFICMVASPTQKWTRQSGSQTPGGKRVKRSVSLPSTRALYNQVLASYASSLRGCDQLDSNSVFIATCLDFLFVPWASSAPSKGLPVASTAAAEAIAVLLLALAPDRPTTLDLDMDFSLLGVPDYVEWRDQSNTSVLYRGVESVLEKVFMHFDSRAPSGTLNVFIRILALYIAPWRSSIRNVLRTQLFPKPRPSSSSVGQRTQPMAALTSRLSSFNAQIRSQTRFPGNASDVKESQWRSELRKRQRCVDEELVRLAVVKAANRRLASLHDGGRSLALLAEATRAARLNGIWNSPDTDQDKADEIRSCLLALRNQKAEYDKNATEREKNYVQTLAASLGVQIEGGGVFSGISGVVGVAGANGVTGAGGMVTGSGTAQPRSHVRGNLRNHLSALRGDVRSDVPFLGNVWDRPIAESENELVVLWSYRLALQLEPRLGFVPNLRFLGRYWFLLLSSLLVCVPYLATRLARVA